MSDAIAEALSKPRWNVLTDRWLDVMTADAAPDVCSPLEALSRANEIRCITASSPLDSHAAHRFLLALLYWHARGVTVLRESLLDGAVPLPVLDAIERAAGRLSLFDDREPFLQDPSARLAKKKSAGSLFAEFSSGTNIAHFHHGDDEGMRLCFPCVTVGILRVVPWTQSGGAGLSPSVHNAPPIVALAIGVNLAVTLGLNLVELDGEAGEPRWSGHFKPADATGAIPYMEAFTWNPRRVHIQSLGTSDVCWRCGRQWAEVVGRFVYAKNPSTQLNKEGRKTVPFQWRDPAAFYDRAAPYVTIKSYDEARAATGSDLGGLLDRNGSRPMSSVLETNPGHRGWLLVVPCTNPANNKTFDHRQYELAGLTTDILGPLVPPVPSLWRQHGVDGWADPRTTDPARGAVVFVQSALRLLNHADWAVLGSAAYRPMHESPAAFDLLSGLLWSLRKNVSGLPSRNAAWLVLKLMGAAPSRARVLTRSARFCPLDALPKRQIDERRGERGVRSPYPLSLPRGQRLEAALRGEIYRHLTQRAAAPIHWPRLCHRLDGLLD
jgi:hypothetical protein